MTSTYTPNDSPFQSPVDSTHLVHWDETVMTPGDHARLYQQWLASQAMTTNAVPFTVYYEEHVRNLKALRTQGATEKTRSGIQPQPPAAPNMASQMRKYAAHLDRDPEAYKCWRELLPTGKHQELTTHPKFAPDRIFVQVDIPVYAQSTSGVPRVFHVETLQPEDGQTVWVPAVVTSAKVVNMIFSPRDPRHRTLRKLGLVHSTEDDAIAHWETLIAPSKAIMDKAFGINGEQPC